MMQPPLAVLIIDSNEGRQAGLCRILERLGHLPKAEASVSGRLSRRGRPLPQACVLSAKAWKEAGKDFLTHCIKKNSPIRLIVYGSDRDVSRAHELFAEGVQAVLQEPVSPTELDVAIEELMAGKPAEFPQEKEEEVEAPVASAERIPEVEWDDSKGTEGTNESNTKGKKSPIREQIRALAEALKKGEAQINSIMPVGIQLQSLCVSEKPSIPQIVAKVSQDPNLAASVLRAANSAAYRGMPRILDLNHAGVRLGLRRLGEVAQMAALRGAYQSRDRDWSRLLSNMWKATVQTAFTARLLGERLNEGNPGSLYSMALLHNLGEVLIVDLARGFSGEPPKKGLADGALKRDMDRHHSPLGAMLLKSWGFAPGVCSIAFAHHDPTQLPEGTPVSRHAWLVGASHKAIVTHNVAYKKDHELGPDISMAAAALGLDEGLFRRAAKEAEEWWDKMGSVG